MASSVPAKKNTAYDFYISLVSQADTKIFQANPTLAAGDAKVCIDDGAPANLATLPVVDADHTKRVKVSLSAAEMNGDHITILLSDAAGAEWCDLMIEIETSARTFDDGVVFATVTMTEAYAADGAAATPAQALYEILAFLEERTISGTTITCKKRDGSTTALTLTMNSATQPTSTTRSG